MTPERWQQIDKLVEQALEQESSQRAGFIDKACAGDEELRREVRVVAGLSTEASKFIEFSGFGGWKPGSWRKKQLKLIGSDSDTYEILSLSGRRRNG